MRIASLHLRKGVAAAILTRIIEVAQQRGYQRLSLETALRPTLPPPMRPTKAPLLGFLWSGLGFGRATRNTVLQYLVDQARRRECRRCVIHETLG